MASRAAAVSSESARPPSRREMLYYLGGASLGLLGAGIFQLFASNVIFHRQRTPEDGFHQVALDDLPAPNAPPIPVSRIYRGTYFIRCHLARNPAGLLALDPRCPYRPSALLKWQTERFACPHCGSQFQLDGTLMVGPASRDMDRYALEIETPRRLLRTSLAGEPVLVDDAMAVYVDAWTLLRGRERR